MKNPTAKLSDKVINSLLSEGLSSKAALASMPEMMIAAHKHNSHEANPPAKMNSMCTQAWC